ncbi:hypothetical protein HPB52_020096 [Rhipicephalus sanguineus]|uniref:Uncharacterized protein n=1 Tax=Rhipicephalus sanguineus TaxID=34632 RepID=A0A9D4Q373_RHISA|nr:hypothetical protein HPB52_020096 [Rhipicephalus sanguineus]
MRGGSASSGKPSVSPSRGVARENHARAELFEHSYSATSLGQKGQAPGGGRGAHATAAAAMNAPRTKRLRCIDGDPGPGDKRPRPSCDSDSPSENGSDDESTTLGDGVDTSRPSTPPPTPQRRQVVGSPQAPPSVPPSGVKRRLFDSEESSKRMSPAFKKYKTSMLLRYIGADQLRETPVRETASTVQAPSKQSRPTAKRPREEQHVHTTEPRKAVPEGIQT